jgi:predicted transcriptional regulator
MGKLTKQMECQQRINQEAQKLMKHFGEEVDLKCYYMRMAKTQAQVISLMRVYETNDDPEGEEILVPKNLSIFFMDCCTLFGLLEPLDNLASEAEKGLRNITGKTTSTKLDKQIDYQQRINKAVEGLLNHFCNELGLRAYYQEMAKAQAQVMSLLRVYEEADTSNSHEEFPYPKDIAIFFCDVCVLFGLLTALDDIACENSGE